MCIYFANNKTNNNRFGRNKTHARNYENFPGRNLDSLDPHTQAVVWVSCSAAGHDKRLEILSPADEAYGVRTVSTDLALRTVLPGCSMIRHHKSYGTPQVQSGGQSHLLFSHETRQQPADLCKSRFPSSLLLLATRLLARPTPTPTHRFRLGKMISLAVAGIIAAGCASRATIASA